MKSIFDKAAGSLIKLPNSAKWVVMIIIAVILLIGRSADPIYNPAMYTEDGTRLGMAYTSGWLNTLLNAKPGYFVWGNIFLLALASLSSKIICGNELICLPQSVAFFSYLFFAFTAAIGFFVTKNTLPLYGRWVVFVWILLLPLGDSSNEIIGRISNIGYQMVLWSVLLVHFKSKTSSDSNYVYVDIGLFFAATTNPLCIVLIPLLAFISSIYKFKRFSTELIKWLYIKFGFIFSALILVLIFSYFHFSESWVFSTTGTFDLGGLIEVGIGRSILFPFIFPLYSELNDLTVLIIFSIAAFLLGILVKNSDFNVEASRLIILLSVALLLFLLATIFFRQSLTQQLSNYSTTFPDRYFMGLNVIAALIVATLLTGGKAKSLGVSKGKAIFAASILTLYVLNLRYVFEYDTPRFKIAVGPSFLQSLCEHKPTSDGIIHLPIYFRGWNMSINSRQHQEALNIIDCSSINTRASDNFYLTDKNWIIGISRFRAGFLTRNTEENFARFKVGNNVIFPNGDKRVINYVFEGGPYLNIWVDGEILNPKDVGLPSKFEVTQ